MSFSVSYFTGKNGQQSSHAFSSVLQVNDGRYFNQAPNSSTHHQFGLFIGDLSYFCQESDIYHLFSRYGVVESCRVVLNETKTKSLMYGFVGMATHESAVLAATVLHNKLFMGRFMKVELSAHRSNPFKNQRPNETGFKIHLAISSNFHFEKVVAPTEELLRKIFERFGPVLDVVIKSYQVYPDAQRQDGYGFVTFSDESAAVYSSCGTKPLVIDGICIVATFNIHNPPTGNKFELGDGTIFVSLGRDSRLIRNVPVSATSPLLSSPRTQFSHEAGLPKLSFPAVGALPFVPNQTGTNRNFDNCKEFPCFIQPNPPAMSHHLSPASSLQCEPAYIRKAIMEDYHYLLSVPSVVVNPDNHNTNTPLLPLVVNSSARIHQTPSPAIANGIIPVRYVHRNEQIGFDREINNVQLSHGIGDDMFTTNTFGHNSRLTSSSSSMNVSLLPSSSSGVLASQNSIFDCIIPMREPPASTLLGQAFAEKSISRSTVPTVPVVDQRLHDYSFPRYPNF